MKESNDKIKDAVLIKKAANAAIFVAAVLIIAKFFAWSITGSVSILATFMDSVFDACASIFNRFVVQISTKPADQNHPFGHRKAEELAVLVQASLISGSAIFLITNAIIDIRNNVTVINENVALIIMLFSTLLTVLLIIYQHFIVIKTNSALIKADSLHYKIDILGNLAVIIALALTWIGYERMDAWFGIAIACYMLLSAIKLAKRAIYNLMDTALPKAELQRIESTILLVDGVYGLHNLRTKGSQEHPIILFDVEVSGALTLYEAHEIGMRAKQAVNKLYPYADVSVHLDPVVSSELQNTI